jgi:hypothetical protein
MVARRCLYRWGMTRLLRALSVLAIVSALSSCGSSVVGQCSPKTCVDGCCTAEAQPRCLRGPLNADNKSCGTSGLQCEDCSTVTSADGGFARCTNAVCR